MSHLVYFDANGETVSRTMRHAVGEGVKRLLQSLMLSMGFPVLFPCLPAFVRLKNSCRCRPFLNQFLSVSVQCPMSVVALVSMAANTFQKR